ncbi:major facilitator superfamily domain-containing protein [Ilyonectria robusta]|uniref:major facilitator superfamily domain-containing protein n=1 Tax=Ilyonectria robusta TaxID=1079257 RepID=UPI001E8D8ECB|nr:major facilitator superfamily domain-containing protein [Ilyonectria robusta]KAH8736509.1 major facilitator superfamily domain-containing protein [Ilyonectria robusta]
MDEIPEELDVEILGRKRPDVFSSTLTEAIFVGSMLMCLSMADFFIGGFQVVLPGLMDPLDIPEASRTWPSSVITLMAGAFLFPFGRLADMYGGYIVFHAGIIWFVTWTIITGFSKTFIMLVFCRAMEGLGAAAFLPAGMSLLGRIYRPGPRKNLVFSLYGALSPLGFFMGMIVGGVSQKALTWGWYFWLGGIITMMCCVGSLLTAPRDYAEARKSGVKMDWWGLCTMVPGLILIIYAITDSRVAKLGWAAPQIIVSLVAGILFLAAAVYVEGWKAEAPLIPPTIFKVKSMKRMLVTLFLTWGVYSIYLFYSNFYIISILKKDSMTAAVWFAPWAVGGLFLAVSSGLLLHILPGRLLLIVSGTCKIVAVLFFALMPDHPNYWAWVFPAMLAEAACVDVLWTVGNVFLTTSLPRHHQGMAGALIYITIFISSAFFLAVTSVVQGKFKGMGMAPKSQYKGMFWIGVGLGVVALIMCFFVDLGKASSQETVQDKTESDLSSSDSETDSPMPQNVEEAKEAKETKEAVVEVRSIN